MCSSFTVRQHIFQIIGWPCCKTLHPAVHGGILANRNKPQHLKELSKQRIDLIDMGNIINAIHCNKLFQTLM